VEIMKITQLREIIREEIQQINEVKLWNYFNEVSNVLSDLRMKGWLKKAEKQNPELKRDLKKVEKAASQLMIWIDDIADRLD